MEDKADEREREEIQEEELRNQEMRKEELRKRRQRRIKWERRRRQVRRQRIILAESAALLSLVIVLISVSVYQNIRAEKQSTALKAAIGKCYEESVSEKGGDTPGAEAEKEGEEFAGWLVKKYENQMRGEFLKKAEEGSLTERDIYNALGETVQVLSDRKKGRLKDGKAAGKSQIYTRDGKSEGVAEVMVAGDLCLEEDGFVLDYYDETEGLSECISPEILDMTNETDIFYLNHEYCVSKRGEPLEGKHYTFRAKPERMGLLGEMGTDLVSLANNHIYDYGEEAMLDTVKYLEKDNVAYVGGGRDKEEAERPVYFIVNGIKIGFVAATNAEMIHYTPAAEKDSAGVLEAYDTAEYNRIIAGASKECDYLIAYVHWGTEDVNEYNDEQAGWGREFLESGADIVVGGHPHVLQGIEYVDSKPIVYSMGDFWFNNETKYAGLLRLNITVDGLEEMSFVPCLQTEYTTQYLSDKEEQEEMYRFLEELSPNAVIDDKGAVKEKGI